MEGAYTYKVVIRVPLQISDFHLLIYGIYLVITVFVVLGRKLETHPGSHTHD